MIQCGYYWDIVDALQFKKKFWIEELKNNSDFKTEIVDIEDGLTISVKVD